VLIPVLDDAKHYWVGSDEVEKLLRHGAGWLPAHPERDLIADRYLKHRRSLTREALARLVDEADPDQAEELHAVEEAAVEEPMSLHQRRLGAVLAVLRASGARRVVDLGCGEGRLLRGLLENGSFVKIAGMDVSQRALDRAGAALHLERLARRGGRGGSGRTDSCPRRSRSDCGPTAGRRTGVVAGDGTPGSGGSVCGGVSALLLAGRIDRGLQAGAIPSPGQ